MTTLDAQKGGLRGFEKGGRYVEKGDAPWWDIESGD